MSPYKNSDEVESWLFEHAQKQGHICDSIKGFVDGEEINIAWRDRETGEEIACVMRASVKDGE